MSAGEIVSRKKQMNARYRKNLQERKRFWKNKNSNKNSVNLERTSY